MKKASNIHTLLIASLIALSPFHLGAASVLYLSDDGSGRQATNIDTLLTADGHSLTTFTSSGGTNFSAFTTALNGDLSSYQVLVLDISDGQTAIGSTEAANILAFATDGGRVFVTGYDSARNYGSWGSHILPVLGAASSQDIGVSPTTVSTESNSLTAGGVVNISGYAFSGDGNDYDTLSGLTADTTAVLNASNGEALWTLRLFVSGGEVAYLSSTWGFDYSSNVAYAGALRNFVGSASAIPEPSSFALAGGFAVLGCASLRRRRA